MMDERKLTPEQQKRIIDFWENLKKEHDFCPKCGKPDLWTLVSETPAHEIWQCDCGHRDFIPKGQEG